MVCSIFLEAIDRFVRAGGLLSLSVNSGMLPCAANTSTAVREGAGTAPWPYPVKLEGQGKRKRDGTAVKKEPSGDVAASGVSSGKAGKPAAAEDGKNRGAAQQQPQEQRVHLETKKMKQKKQEKQIKAEKRTGNMAPKLTTPKSAAAALALQTKASPRAPTERLTKVPMDAVCQCVYCICGCKQCVSHTAAHVVSDHQPLQAA